MASDDYYDMETDNDDLDEDIERLKVVLQDDEQDQEEESDGELKSLGQNDEIFTASYASRPSTGSDITASSLPTTSMGTEADDIGFRVDSRTINSDSCLAMNRAYQEVLLDVLRQIEVALSENRKRQNELEEELNEKGTKSGRNRTDVPNSHLADMSIPYFKDADGNIPPPNEDVKLKAHLKESKQEVKPRPPWSKVARKQMLNAVSMDSLEKLVRPLLNKLEVEMTKLQLCKNQQEIDECTERIETLQQTIQEKQNTPLEELLDIVDTDKIDFMKISVVEFDAKYDAFECELMWRNVLHPNINREKWTSQEEETLQALAMKHECRGWDKIAEELGTKRTPFQCLQHYQQRRHTYELSEWTEEEDEFLKEVVEACKYGKGKIHWNQVSYYINGRSADMCEKRWFKINPERKRGRWTEDEDMMLMAAVKMCGETDWLRLAQHVPHRSAAQCRERWTNCLSPNISLVPWSYEEDKQLMQLYKQHGSMWTLTARKMAGRTDNMCLARYQKLMRWKKDCEEFHQQPLSVQKELIHSQFGVHPQSKVIVLKSLAPMKKRKTVVNGTPENSEDEESSSDEEYLPELDNIESGKVLHSLGQDWDAFAKRHSIHLADYEKQYIDMQNGDMVVPRPPPLKRYSTRSFAKTWERRRQLQSVVEMQIFSSIQKLQSQRNLDSSVVLSHVSKTLSPFMSATEKQKEELIASAMQGRQPHELSVKEMLDISRAIANIRPEQKISMRQLRPVRRKRKLDGMVEIRSSDEDSDSDDNLIRMEQAGKVLTEAQKKVLLLREQTRIKNSSYQDQLKNIVASKLCLTYTNVHKAKGRRRHFSLFPPSSYNKQSDDLAEEEKRKRRSMALMMKTLNMDPEATYQEAVRSQRRIAALAMLQSTSSSGRTRRRPTIARTTTKLDSSFSTDCEEVLSLRKELGVKNSASVERQSHQQMHHEDGGEGHSQRKNTGELKAGTSQEGLRTSDLKEESYDRQLPFIPPNVKNLHGIRTLLMEYRCLVESAKRYFDRDDLKDRLYEIKRSGRSNRLLHVLGSAGQMEPKLMRKNVKTEPSEQLQNPAEVVQHVKKTKAFKQLRARFQSIFSWPALMSTIKPPKDNKPIPDFPFDQESPESAAVEANETADTVEMVVVDDGDTDTAGKSSVVTAKSHAGAIVSADSVAAKTTDTDTPEGYAVSTKTVAAGTSESTEAGTDPMEDETENLEHLTEEEAIEKLVEKIMKEYKETRKPRRPTKHKLARKKTSDKVRNATHVRERKKILKRLGLYEKMQQFELQRLQRQTEAQNKEKNTKEKNGQETVSAGNSSISSSVPVSTASSFTAVMSSVSTSTDAGPDSVAVEDLPPDASCLDMPLIDSSSPDSRVDVSSPRPKPVPLKSSPQTDDAAEHLAEIKQEPGTLDLCKEPVRKRGRPFGSKSNAKLKEQDVTPRKSDRTVKKPVVLKEYQSKGLDNTPGVKRKTKRVEVANKRLKEMIPEKLTDMIPYLPSLPIMSEPQPSVKPDPGEVQSSEVTKEKQTKAQKTKQSETEKGRGRRSLRKRSVQFIAEPVILEYDNPESNTVVTEHMEYVAANCGNMVSDGNDMDQLEDMTDDAFAESDYDDDMEEPTKYTKMETDDHETISSGGAASVLLKSGEFRSKLRQKASSISRIVENANANKRTEKASNKLEFKPFSEVSSKAVLTRLREKVVNSAADTASSQKQSEANSKNIAKHKDSTEGHTDRIKDKSRQNDRSPRKSPDGSNKKRSLNRTVKIIPSKDTDCSTESPLFAVPVSLHENMGNETDYTEDLVDNSITQEHSGRNLENCINTQAKVSSEPTPSSYSNDAAITASSPDLHDNAPGSYNIEISVASENSGGGATMTASRDSSSGAEDLFKESSDSHNSSQPDVAPVMLPTNLFPGGDSASMFVAVPVMVGNVKQMACMPVVKNADGTFVLPYENPSEIVEQGMKLPVSVIPTQSSSSDSTSTSLPSPQTER